MEEKIEEGTQKNGNNSSVSRFRTYNIQANLILVFIFIIIIIGILVSAFYTWQNHQKLEQEQLIEKQYQACLEKCRLASMGFDYTFKVCEAECKEKYGK